MNARLAAMTYRTTTHLMSTQHPDFPSDPSRVTPGGSTTAVLERDAVGQEIEPGDHERFSHYVRKEQILESAMTGQPVKALCGKMWIPGRDPQKFPVCPICKEIYEGLRPGGDDGDEGGDQ